MSEIIEEATNEAGDKYQLLRAGWGFKSVVTRQGQKPGKPVRHRFVDQARKSEQRKGFEL